MKKKNSVDVNFLTIYGQKRVILLFPHIRCCFFISCLSLFRNCMFSWMLNKYIVILNQIFHVDTNVIVGSPDKSTQFGNVVSYMTPLNVPMGFSTISATQSLSGSLSRWPTVCSAVLWSFFCCCCCFVLFFGKHLSPNNIPPVIVWIGGTVHSNPELAGCETWHLSSPACYNPCGAVERNCHHGHTEWSTLRLKSL